MDVANKRVEDERGAPVRARPGRVGSLVRDYAERGTLHGIYQVATPGVHPVRRFLWSILMLACAASLLYVFIGQLTLFLNYDVQTVLSVEQKPAIEFPSVTMCNYNQFRKSQALKNPGTAKILEELFSVEARLKREQQIQVRHANARVILSDQDLINRLVNMSHTLEKMIDYCSWCGKQIPCAQYFSMTMTEVGVCYTFNSREIRNARPPLLVHDAGSDCGLVLRINIEAYEYYYGEGVSSGIRAMVHDPGEVPLVRQYGFSVPPGRSAVAPIRVTKDLYAQSPYGHCVDTEHGAFENWLKYYNYYTYTACKLENRVDFIYNICKCRMYYDPSNLTLCKTVEDVICWMNAKENFTQTGMKAMREACPPTCASMTYDVRVSYAQFPAPTLVEEIRNKTNLTEEAISRNLLVMNVFFEDLGVHIVKQQPAYTGTSLFSDIGGLMGLCLGASLLTLMELLELLAFMLIRATKGR